VTPGAARASVLSHFSLPREHPFVDRVRLAGAHGFSQIGFFVGHYMTMRDEHGRDRALALMRDTFAEHGVTLGELEVIPGLGRDGVGGERAQLMELAAWELADEFSSRYLQVIGPAQCPPDRAAQLFGELCDRAGDHGLVVGLEFLPFTDVFSVLDARRIVEAAGRPNGGICVDIWHHERGANDLGAIADLPGEFITGIQFSDGPASPLLDDYKADCLASRVPPGEGTFDVPGFLAAVDHAPIGVPISYEVCSATGWAAPDEHIAAVARARNRLFG
jgi:sugar phosphate isomerase/epimerase